MALGRGFQQRVQDAGLDTVIGICHDPHAAGDLIGYLEPDAGDIVGQPVGILPDDPVHTAAVLPVDLRGQVHGDAVLLEKDHGLPHIFLLLHLRRDVHGHALADALDLGQTLRLLLNDAEGVLLKAAHDTGRQSRSHAFDRAGPQIALHGGRVPRRPDHVGFHGHLFAVDRMLGHGPHRFDGLALAYIMECPHQHEFRAV